MGPSLVAVRLRVKEYPAASTPATPQAAMMSRIAPAVMRGKRTEAVRMIERVTSTPTTAAVKALVFGPFTQGPRTSLSLQSSSRKTEAEGSRTPARVCTPAVSRPSGEPGISTMVAASPTSPA